MRTHDCEFNSFTFASCIGLPTRVTTEPTNVLRFTADDLHAESLGRSADAPWTLNASPRQVCERVAAFDRAQCQTWRSAHPVER